MNSKIVWFLVALTVTINGCKTPAVVEKPVEINYEQLADDAFSEGNWQNALANYEQTITNYEAQKKSLECPVYGKAGLAAMNMGQTQKSLEYLEKNSFTPFVTIETIHAQAVQYREVNNLSKEIDALNLYLEKFPEGKDAGAFRARLFETCYESQDYELATRIWAELGEEYRKTPKYLETWMLINKRMKNDPACDEIALDLIKADPNNVMGLEWLAKKYYFKAEDRYQAEMQAYEKNKTKKQYAILVEAFKLLTEDFKVSLVYFERLYKINPAPDYANFMGNIYARFDDKKNADFYHNLGTKN